MDLDLSGGPSARLALRGTQMANLETKALFKLTVSQTNDEPMDAATRTTFSFQTTDDMRIGEPLNASGHLQLDGGFFGGTCTVVVHSAASPALPSHVRWMEGTVECPEMRFGSAPPLHVSGRFAGPVVDNTL